MVEDPPRARGVPKAVQCEACTKSAPLLDRCFDESPHRHHHGAPGDGGASFRRCSASAKEDRRELSGPESHLAPLRPTATWLSAAWSKKEMLLLKPRMHRARLQRVHVCWLRWKSPPHRVMFQSAFQKRDRYPSALSNPTAGCLSSKTLIQDHSLESSVSPPPARLPPVS